MKSSTSQTTPADNTINRGLGGFPYPTELLRALLKKLIRPQSGNERSTSDSHSQNGALGHGTYRTALDGTLTYFSDTFNAMVGRNSKFYSLTDDHLEELGGVEFRAINALLWVIAVVSYYH